VIALVNAKLNALSDNPPARDRAEALRAGRRIGPAGSANHVREEAERWAALIRRSGAKVD
jgi:hypothetical protein